MVAISNAFKHSITLTFIALVMGCETTHAYRPSDVYTVNQVNEELICGSQRAGMCTKKIKNDWPIVKKALLQPKPFLHTSQQPHNYLAEAALIYWGSLNQVAIRHCPNNQTSCRPYTNSDLSAPYPLDDYIKNVNVLNQYRIETRAYQFVTNKVSEINITEQGHCESELSTAHNVCAYLNGPSMAEQAGVTNNTKANPYQRNKKNIAGNYLVFDITATATGIKTDHPDFNSLNIKLAVPGTKVGWQKLSWQQVQKQLNKAVVLL